MRRTFLLGLIALPSALGLALYGCGSDEPPLEDFCGWLKDPENCFRKFAIDSTKPTDGPRCTNLSKDPAKAPAAGKSQIGVFQGRDKLDTCFVQTGGIITFDTPVNLAKLPPTKVAFTMVNADNSECGKMTFAAVDDFSVKIKGDLVPDGGTLGDTQVAGGLISYKRTENRDTVTATCPTGESHYFDTLQVAKCPEYVGGIPRAELDVIQGGLDAQGRENCGGNYGAIKFRVFYEQPTGDLANSSPLVVEYFTCLFPPPPPLCADGMQDGGETDVDCGGVTSCDRCPDGGKCITAADCLGGHDCTVLMGLSKCTAPGTTSATTSAATTTSSTGTGTGGAGGGASTSSAASTTAASTGAATSTAAAGCGP